MATMHSIGLLSLVVLVLACVGLSTADVPTLVILPSGTAAQCLDGTPPGYYWQAASTPESRNNWVIFFQGGGMFLKKQKKSSFIIIIINVFCLFQDGVILQKNVCNAQGRALGLPSSGRRVPASKA